MQGIIPQPEAASTAAPMDVSALAFVLTNMDPDALAPVLPGESWEEILGRREAVRDMVDELLAEFVGQEEAGAGWRKASYSGTHPEGNCVEVRVVRPAPGGGCTFCGGDGTDGAGHTCLLC